MENRTVSTATRPQNQRPAQQSQAASLLDQILDRPPSERMKAVSDALEKRIQAVEEVLPDAIKPQAARFVKRAQLTFSRKEELQECEPASLVRCVVEAAEVGLAIDGKLCHAVAYNCKISKKGEPERWAKMAQLQIDYKGLIAIARRSGQIVDIWGDIVCEGEEFEAYRDGVKQVLRHTPAFRTGKEAVIGAYAIIDFGGGRFRYEVMGEREIDAIRQKSKAKDRGPWVDFTNEMRKKTVIRRALKTHCDDPAVSMALEIEEREYEDDTTEAKRSGQRVGRSVLNDVLSQPPRESEGPTLRTGNEFVGALEQHFGGESEPEPDRMAQIEQGFAEAVDADAVAMLYDSLKGPEAIYEFTPEESDRIEQLRVQAMGRFKGGKKQKELG